MTPPGHDHGHRDAVGRSRTGTVRLGRTSIAASASDSARPVNFRITAGCTARLSPSVRVTPGSVIRDRGPGLPGRSLTGLPVGHAGAAGASLSDGRPGPAAGAPRPMARPAVTVRPGRAGSIHGGQPHGRDRNAARPGREKLLGVTGPGNRAASAARRPPRAAAGSESQLTGMFGLGFWLTLPGRTRDHHWHPRPASQCRRHGRRRPGLAGAVRVTGRPPAPGRRGTPARPGRRSELSLTQSHLARSLRRRCPSQPLRLRLARHGGPGSDSA